MIYAPLVMPEVITGLSLLLLFVTIAVDRGFWTVAIAHTTMAMCFVTVIVQSRLSGFDTSLEEAAADLGASPSRTFLSITLPPVAPAIAAAWMLASALWHDDRDRELHHRSGHDHAADPHLFRGAARRETEMNAVYHYGGGRRRCRDHRLAACEADRRGEAARV
jgi:hypothetical protein